ncbi:helix-turn-helix transcriptional regulator [Bifidobacterium aquikefiri]|uniref:helix-turn-helix transcriptional regulator n=1 Tax=Bifidobacterium aquikefiri TaxID=1653207 RepID=UPI0039E9C07D
MSDDQLAAYLRARRAQLEPRDVGLVAGRRRRVPGLRREEVATLAGISSEYYVRLEQGRDVNPSAQVVAALAHALRLDAEATAYLGLIAGRAMPQYSSGDEEGNSDIQMMIDTWPLTAAYVQGHTCKILAANSLAAELSTYFSIGANPMRAVFLAPEMRELYRDWDHMTIKAVAFLRSVLATDDNPAVQDLVRELRARSERFRMLWNKYNVKISDRGDTLLRHPKVGCLDLRFQKFILPESKAILVTYQAAPGSASEASLRVLAASAHNEQGK